MGKYTWDPQCEGCVLACDLIETNSMAVVYACDTCPVHGLDTDLVPNQEEPIPPPEEECYEHQN
jgi:hypothetical protein